MFEAFREADPILYYLGLSGVLKHVLFYVWKGRKPAEAKDVARITKLMIYPFKSAHGICVNELHCSPGRGASHGPVSDRRWMTVTCDYDMVSSRQQPLVGTIQTRMDGSKLVLSSSRSNDLVLDATETERKNQVVDTHVHGVFTKALDCGEEAAQWISEFLKKPGGFRIVYAGNDIYTRGVIGGNKKYIPWTKIAKQEDKLAFHDSISFHMCAEESMSDLNSRMLKTMDVTRFRPNIIVSTNNVPYCEDTWRNIFVGGVTFETLKLCARCVLPNVNPATGDKGDEPLRTLNEYRQLLPSPLGPAFGIDMIVECQGSIKTGDRMYAIQGDNLTKP